MKIGEAREKYSAQMSSLRNRRQELQKQLEKSSDPEVQARFDIVDKQYQAASGFMEGFSIYTTMLENMETSKKQSKAMEDQADEMTKCLEIARRISRGDKVPYEDEQRLMNYNKDLYMMSKCAAMNAKNKDPKEYDSLWKDEEEPSPEDKMSAEEIVDSMECTMTMPTFEPETE